MAYRWKRRRLSLALGLLTAAAGGWAATGCASPPDSPPSAKTAASSSAQGRTSPPASTSQCLDVSPAMQQAILTGAQAGTGMRSIQAKAYRSPDFEKVYFIAMKFSATGVGDQVGVWASSDLAPGRGPIMSVDGLAEQFTDWGVASSTDAQISAADPGVAKAKACL